MESLQQPGVLCALCVVAAMGERREDDEPDSGMRKLLLHAPQDSELRAALEQGACLHAACCRSVHARLMIVRAMQISGSGCARGRPSEEG